MILDVATMTLSLLRDNYGSSLLVPGQHHADHALGTFKTQREAIDWAKKPAHSPLLARVRDLNDKNKPDHWRSAKARSARGVGAGAGARPNDPPRYIIVDDWNDAHYMSRGPRAPTRCN